MGVLRVERVTGWSGVRVSWPVPEGVLASDYFGNILPAYTREGDAVDAAAAGAWVADVALHADLIARPARLGLADGAVTVGDRSVPLRVGVELPPGLVMPVTAARLAVLERAQGRELRALAQVSAAAVRAWSLDAVARMGLDQAAAAAERERRRYFLALCAVMRATTYDAVDAAAPGAAERAGGVALGPLAGGPVLLVASGVASCFEVLKGFDGAFASPAAERARREKIAAAARAYVARLAAYQASGRRELPEATDVERTAATDVATEAERELWLWQSASGAEPSRSDNPLSALGGGSGFKLGTVGKLAVGLFVVKTVLGD